MDWLQVIPAAGGEPRDVLREPVRKKGANIDGLSPSFRTPGSGAPAVCGKGIYISEFSDALGTGNYIYEFVELYNEN